MWLNIKTLLDNADSVIVLSKMSPSDKVKYYKRLHQKFKNFRFYCSLKQKRIKPFKILERIQKENVIILEQHYLLVQVICFFQILVVPLGKNNVKAIDDSVEQKTLPISSPAFFQIRCRLIYKVVFIFIIQQLLRKGKLKFKKKWGEIETWSTIGKVWVASSNQNNQNNQNPDEEVEDAVDINEIENSGAEPKYTTAFYIDKLPKDAKVLDSLNIEANHARFQLGSIFKEKLKENELAVTSFEDILTNKPESIN